MAIRVLVGVLAALGIVILVGAGWGGLGVYLVFVGIVAAFSAVIGGGGDLIRDASRRRHDHRP